MLFRSLCRCLFFRLLGWKEEVSVEPPAKCILCVAPHTSNADFFLAKLYYWAVGRTSGFLMKREWFFWPLGSLLRAMGGVPVERSRHTSLTDQLAQRARQSERFTLAVTPEGTRSLAPVWKRGFYFIALKAGIPIVLYGLDYGRKTIVCNQILTPSGDVEADMRLIMDFYRPFQARHPEKFTVEDLDASHGAES